MLNGSANIVKSIAHVANGDGNDDDNDDAADDE